MRALLYTTGSPFARAIRIMLSELGLECERREEVTTPTAERLAEATPTLQVPTFWDDGRTLWESGVIAEYFLATYDGRPEAVPPLAAHPWRPEAEWQDRLTFATIQTFGNAATTISQMRWSGVPLDRNAHMERSAEKLTHILRWLEALLGHGDGGFLPGRLSIQDIFLACHVRFVEARPLGIDLNLPAFPKVAGLLDRLDQRASFVSEPVWWWEPGIIGYQPDGTPLRLSDPST
jgi:glutathione S-transferase